MTRERVWFIHVILYIAFYLIFPVNSQTPPEPYLRTPSTRQLSWHQLEYYAFVHFGPNTFTNEEWGRSQPTPDVFTPTALDTDQWAKSFSEAGMAGMILTAKHHDGMALWNTTTTEYKVANGKWAKDKVEKGEDTDIVRMAAQSAKKFGLKFGVYLSPWDIHRDPSMPKDHLKGTKYDEAQIFGDSSPGDYNELYAKQLTELVTMKTTDGSPIELFEIWLDGASGSSTIQTFDWASFRDIIRKHQPDAIMWGHQGVDARWVGNEDGVTVNMNWHTISRTQDDPRYSEAELQTGVRDGAYWTPAEADARIRDGWFFHPNEVTKSADTLMDMYLQSVGRSVNLLLDVPPDTTGQLVSKDIQALLDFKLQRESFLRRTISTQALVVNASSTRNEDNAVYGPLNILSDNASTYWAPMSNSTTGTLEIGFNGVYNIDGFIVQEHIALGQRIGEYTIEGLVNDTWKAMVTGTSMGYKRIHQLVFSTTATKVRLTVTGNASPLIQMFRVIGWA